MNENKHICSLNFCEQHGECFYKNEKHPTSEHGEIVCYQKDWVESLHKEETKIISIKRVEDSNDSWNFELQLRKNKRDKNVKLNEPHCQNPKCFSVADTKLNGTINLCYECLDTLRGWKTNYELGTIFKKKEKILKLFTLIEELSPPKKEVAKEMIRCSNIYCGTLDRMTKHHLIPKAFRNRETVEKIPLCEDCHKKVHRLATNMELAKYYNTKQSVIELLSKDVLFRKERVLNAYENSNLMAVA